MRDKYILLIAMCAMLVVVVGLAYIMNDPEPEPVGDWESITADDVKFIVVETAMKVYRDGRMNEPREIHAQEACQLWFEHYSKPSSYWRDKINQAEHERMTNALPALVIVRALTDLDNLYASARPAIVEYCDAVVRG